MQCWSWRVTKRTSEPKEKFQPKFPFPSCKCRIDSRQRPQKFFANRSRINRILSYWRGCLEKGKSGGGGPFKGRSVGSSPTARATFLASTCLPREDLRQPYVVECPGAPGLSVPADATVGEMPWVGPSQVLLAALADRETRDHIRVLNRGWYAAKSPCPERPA